MPTFISGQRWQSSKGRARSIAQRQVELINTGDYSGVAALYADNATLS